MRFKDTLGISFYLKVLQNEFRQRLDTKLKPLNLTSAQYGVLAVIEEGKPLTGADLARRCFVSPQTMNRILKTLVKDGLVVRQPHPVSHLKLEYRFTKKADQLLCRAHAIVNTLEIEMIRGFAKKDVAKMIKMMKVSFENLAGQE